MPDYIVRDPQGRRIGRIEEDHSGCCCGIWLFLTLVFGYLMYIVYMERLHTPNWLEQMVFLGGFILVLTIATVFAISR